MPRFVALLIALAAAPLLPGAIALAEDTTVVVHAHGDDHVHYGRPERTAKNSLYFEALGNGLFYTLNYERFIGDIMSIRAGLGYFAVSAQGDGESGNVSTLSVPIMLNFFLGGPDHKMELGAGILNLYASGSADTLAVESSGSGVAVVGTATIAYRYAPHDGGFSWKAGLTPMFGAFGFLPWVGFSFGVTL